MRVLEARNDEPADAVEDAGARTDQVTGLVAVRDDTITLHGKGIRPGAVTDPDGTSDDHEVRCHRPSLSAVSLARSAAASSSVQPCERSQADVPPNCSSTTASSRSIVAACGVCFETSREPTSPT